MINRFLVLSLVCIPICAWGSQTSTGGQLLPVSSSSLPLPPPPDFSPPSADAPPPPPPPPPAGSYPTHFEIALPVAANFGGRYQDFSLPPLKKVSVTWTALDGARRNISSQLTLEVQSSAPLIKLSPTGASEMATDENAANVRVIVRRNKYVGAFGVRVVIELKTIQ